MKESKIKVLFKTYAPINTKTVEVIGDFNNWKKGSFYLDDDDKDNIWEGYIELNSGSYRYKFLIDGKEYRLDEYNNRRIKDEKGEIYSYLEIGMSNFDILHDQANHISYLNKDEIIIKVIYNLNKFKNISLIVDSGNKSDNLKCDIIYFDKNYNYGYFKIKKNLSKKFYYYFICEEVNGNLFFYGKNGIQSEEWKAENFELNLNNEEEYLIPDEYKYCIFYQIFPDRFKIGKEKKECKDNKKFIPIDKDPDYISFYGGDLAGIIDSIDYLKDLGINAIYLNPIFLSNSYHRYSINDYKKIDTILGNEEDFDRLVKTLKQNNIKLVLDGVFNHTGTEFFAFKDIEEKQEKSKYLDWYFIKKFPLIENKKPNYECWWGFPSLPKLNLNNPDVEKYIIDVSLYWIGKGIDGWRLDAANEIEHSFWKKFYKIIKDYKKDIILIGEIWQNAKEWLINKEFDSVMNYCFRDACVEFFAKRRIKAKEFVSLIGSQLFEYPFNNNFLLLNLLSSHDTPRFFTVANENINLYKNAIVYQMTGPGIPSIYYGEEISMTGGKDPDNRRFMRWDVDFKNNEIFQFYKKMIEIRKKYRCLSDGLISFIYANDMTIGFERCNQNERVIVFINNGDKPSVVDLTKRYGNGEFKDIFRNSMIKRKKLYSIYPEDFSILIKVKNR